MDIYTESDIYDIENIRAIKKKQKTVSVKHIGHNCIRLFPNRKLLKVLFPETFPFDRFRW